MEKREIKFRFWDTVTNSWCVDGKKETDIYDFAFRSGMNWTYISRSQALNRVTIMQYTGLKDKAGVEIYEGDVVRAKSHSPSDYCIEFIEGAFCGTNPKLKNYPCDINHFYDSTGCHIEVIGNIFQHPELLNLK